MAFTGNFSCNTLRTGLINGTLSFATDTFRLALYTNSASLNQLTTAYTVDGEASGGNYAAGGLVVAATVSTALSTTGSTIYVNFASAAWTGAITARGALIYKAGANGAVCVLDFGNDKISTSTFTVTMPADTSTSALIRLV
jgi:glycogen synthase